MAFDPDFMIFGHRGASGLEPENTLGAFQRAVSLGVDGIELDVHLKDGRLLVIHDDKVDRCTNGSGKLEALELDYIRSLNAGLGQQIPFLEELFESLPESLALNIEIKSARSVKGTAKALAAVLERFPNFEVLVSSFQHDELDDFRAIDRRTKVAPLYHKLRPDMLERALGLDAWSINISRRFANAQLIKEIVRNNFKAYIWTVNEIEEAERYREWGASGIMTDYPDRFAN